MGDTNNIWQTQLATAATQTGQAALGQIMGMVFGKAQDKRQLKQQEKLQQLQIAGSKELTDYNYAKQLQMWKDTNYGAQVEQLEAAGLNPGLLYGMSGGGGTTTGSGGGATTTGGQAPHGGNEGVAMAQTYMELGLQRSQMRLMEAQANKAAAEAENLRGGEREKLGAEVQSLLQGIQSEKAKQKLTEAQTTLTNLQSELTGKTIDEQEKILKLTVGKLTEEVAILETQKELDGATRLNKQKIIYEQAIGAALQNQLTKAHTQESKQNVEESKAKINKMAAEIAQDWYRIAQNQQNLSRQERELNLKRWEAQIKANFPGISQVIGKVLNGMFEQMADKMTIKGGGLPIIHEAPKQ